LVNKKMDIPFVILVTFVTFHVGALMSGRFFLGKVFAKKKVGERMFLDPTKFVDEDADEHAHEHVHEDDEGCAGDLLSQKGDDGKAGDAVVLNASGAAVLNASGAAVLNASGAAVLNASGASGAAGNLKSSGAPEKRKKKAERAAGAAGAPRAKAATVKKVWDMLRAKGVKPDAAKEVKSTLANLLMTAEKAKASAVLREAASEVMIAAKHVFQVGKQVSKKMLQEFEERVNTLNSTCQGSTDSDADRSFVDSNNSATIVSLGDKVSAYQTQSPILSYSFFSIFPLSYPAYPMRLYICRSTITKCHVAGTGEILPDHTSGPRPTQRKGNEH
jgi:hypothetical protein